MLIFVILSPWIVQCFIETSKSDSKFLLNINEYISLGDYELKNQHENKTLEPHSYVFCWNIFLMNISRLSDTTDEKYFRPKVDEMMVTSSTPEKCQRPAFFSLVPSPVSQWQQPGWSWWALLHHRPQQWVVRPAKTREEMVDTRLLNNRMWRHLSPRVQSNNFNSDIFIVAMSQAGAGDPCWHPSELFPLTWLLWSWSPLPSCPIPPPPRV